MTFTNINSYYFASTVSNDLSPYHFFCISTHKSTVMQFPFKISQYNHPFSLFYQNSDQQKNNSKLSDDTLIIKQELMTF